MCFYCKATKTQQGTTTHVVTLENCVIIVRHVPCEECVQCGEKYYTDEVMERLEEIVEQAKSLCGELLVTEYSEKVA